MNTWAGVAELVDALAVRLANRAARGLAFEPLKDGWPPAEFRQANSGGSMPSPGTSKAIEDHFAGRAVERET